MGNRVYTIDANGTVTVNSMVQMDVGVNAISPTFDVRPYTKIRIQVEVLDEDSGGLWPDSSGANLTLQYCLFTAREIEKLGLDESEIWEELLVMDSEGASAQIDVTTIPYVRFRMTGVDSTLTSLAIVIYGETT